MKKLIILFLFAGFVFACKTDKKVENTETGVEELQKAIEEEKTDLSSFEYICAHCQMGSHEAGKCPCGMDYEKNPGFAGILDGDDTGSHGHKDHDNHKES